VSGIRDVAVVGLGVMGRPMARRLLAAGFRVRVWNRSRAAVEELAAAGAIPAASAAEAARGAQAALTVLPDSGDVERAVLGPAGIAEGLAAGSAGSEAGSPAASRAGSDAASRPVVVDLSTISPAVTERIAAALAARGVEMLDAPVTGGERGAIEGSLTIMAGGPPDALERCRPVLEALGRRIVHTGAAGSGQRTKLVNQAITAQVHVAMAEGLALARRFGLDAERTLEVVSSGTAGSWVLTHLAPRVLAGDVAPGFTIRLMRKDLRLADEAARELGLDVPGARLALDAFSRADEEGLGALGTQAVAKLYDGDGFAGDAPGENARGSENPDSLSVRRTRTP
jgi:3-hydroxyisobutyrate dehydrogenase